MSVAQQLEVCGLEPLGLVAFDPRLAYRLSHVLPCVPKALGQSMMPQHFCWQRAVQVVAPFVPFGP